MGDINSECCEFEVQYLNEDGTVIVELYKDLKAGDIVILWSVISSVCVRLDKCIMKKSIFIQKIWKRNVSCQKAVDLHRCGYELCKEIMLLQCFKSTYQTIVLV